MKNNNKVNYLRREAQFVFMPALITFPSVFLFFTLENNILNTLYLEKQDESRN